MYEADRNVPWGWKLATDPTDALNFINGAGTYQHPPSDLKITATGNGPHPSFYIFYQRDPGLLPAGGWGWKRATNVQDAWNFVNGTGGYSGAVSDVRICGVANAGHAEFHIFYRKSAPARSGRWGWKLAPTLDDATHFLAGQGAYQGQISRAEVVTIVENNQPRYYIFYQGKIPGQSAATWRNAAAGGPDAVLHELGREGSFPTPVHDGKIVTSCTVGTKSQFLVFKPTPFLIITRPLFVNTLREYMQWKSARGFDVHLVTAEWADAHAAGADVRARIRNVIRHYNSTIGLEYALLVGDSVDTTPPDAPPPPPSLSEAWNLPAGYYHLPIGYQFTTLYYSDVTDKMDYVAGDPGWRGDYRVAVGVLPVRTSGDLMNLLHKTIAAQPTRRLSSVYSQVLYPTDGAQRLAELKGLAGAAATVTESVFGSSAPPADIYAALFAQPGAILESGHGNLGEFVIGGTSIVNADAQRFQQINPLFMTISCYVQSYHLGECLDEAYLKTLKGPAVMMTIPPTGGLTQSGKKLSELEARFWKDLFAGKSIGKAFYDHCHGASMNPLHLFGDPSAIIIGGPT